MWLAPKLGNYFGRVAARLARLRRNQSMLDAVTKQIARLNSALGPRDQAKFDEFLESIRDVGDAPSDARRCRLVYVGFDRPAAGGEREHLVVALLPPARAERAHHGALLADDIGTGALVHRDLDRVRHALAGRLERLLHPRTDEALGVGILDGLSTIFTQWPYSPRM